MTKIFRAQKPLEDCSVTVKMAANGSYIWELRSTKTFDTPAQAFYDAMLNFQQDDPVEKVTDDPFEDATMLDIVRRLKDLGME